jgi:hypothetical protein
MCAHFCRWAFSFIAGSSFSGYGDFMQEKHKEKSFLRTHRPLAIGMDYTKRRNQRQQASNLEDKCLGGNAFETHDNDLLNETGVFGLDSIFSGSKRRAKKKESKHKLAATATLISTMKTQILFISRQHFFKHTSYHNRQIIRKNAKAADEKGSNDADVVAQMKWLNYRRKLVNEVVGDKRRRYPQNRG